MISILILAALWLVVLWRIPGLAQDPWKRAPWIALAALAVALTATLPVTARAIDRAAGVADLSVLAQDLAGITASGAVLEWVSSLKDARRRPGFRRHHAAAAAAVAALIILFILMPRPETSDFAATAAGGPAAAYLLVFCLYVGTAMTIATRLFWHVSRYPPEGSPRRFRWGMRLLGTGTTLGALSAACQIAYAALRTAGILRPAGVTGALAVTTGTGDLAILAIIAAMTIPALGTAWENARDLADLWSLGEMRAILVTAVPGITAGPLTRRPGESLSHTRLLLSRRTAEIRDAALALRCRVAPGAVTVARYRLAARGLEGTALDAAAEACWLRLALHAAWSGHPPVTIAHALPGHDDLREETRWLHAISAAARTDDVTAVTRQLAGEPASDSCKWPSVTTAARPSGSSFTRRVTRALTFLARK